jgi:hypothetical protein
VSFTLDRYGHLFPGHDAELRDRLDAMHAEGLKGTAGGGGLRASAAALGVRAARSIAFGRLGGIPGRASVVNSDRVVVRAGSWESAGYEPSTLCIR